MVLKLYNNIIYKNSSCIIVLAKYNTGMPNYFGKNFVHFQKKKDTTGK